MCILLIKRKTPIPSFAAHWITWGLKKIKSTGHIPQSSEMGREHQYFELPWAIPADSLETTGQKWCCSFQALNKPRAYLTNINKISAKIIRVQ